MIREGAEWYLDHYPVLNEIMEKYHDLAIIIFSYKCFDLKKEETFQLLKN